MSLSARHKRKRKDGRPYNAASPRMLLARQRELKMIEMRIAGLTQHEIACKLGVTDARVCQMLTDLLNRWDADVIEKVPQARQLELERCDELLRRLQKGIRKGDVKAILAALKVAERRARLRGLDKPVDVQHSGSVSVLSVDAFRKMLDDADAAEAEVPKPDGEPQAPELHEYEPDGLGAAAGGNGASGRAR